jgi:hypothetical protein
MLNSHTDGCDAIIILNPASEPVHISLSTVTLEKLRSQQEMLKALLGRCNVRTREESQSTRLFGHREDFTSKTVTEHFEEILTWLWFNIVDPVYQVLAMVGVDN